MKAASLLAPCRRTPSRSSPRLLGAIGEAHFQARFEALGCEMEILRITSKVEDYDDEGMPFLIETAFGWFPAGETSAGWSPA